MKNILISVAVLFLLGCNTKQRDYENSLLFPEKHKYSFDVKYDIQYFPDVIVYSDFSCTPSKKTLKAIHEEFVKFKNEYKNVFVHEFTFIEDRYALPLNFNAIDFTAYSELDMQKDIRSFDFLLKNLDTNPDVQDLIGVHFK